MRVKERPLRVLDFDIENRPLSYRGKNVPPTSEMTAIAWCWIREDGEVDESEVEVVLLGRHTKRQMLTRFLKVYDLADMVVGHFIRGHDLKTINGECLEHGFPRLSPKLAQDTYSDLTRRGDLPGSQEALAAMLGVPGKKVHMDQHHWREANRLTGPGIEFARERCVEDVIQNIHLRRRLIDDGFLKTPRIWRP